MKISNFFRSPIALSSVRFVFSRCGFFAELQPETFCAGSRPALIWITVEIPNHACNRTKSTLGNLSARGCSGRPTSPAAPPSEQTPRHTLQMPQHPRIKATSDYNGKFNCCNRWPGRIPPESCVRYNNTTEFQQELQESSPGNHPRLVGFRCELIIFICG